MKALYRNWLNTNNNEYIFPNKTNPKILAVKHPSAKFTQKNN